MFFGRIDNRRGWASHITYKDFLCIVKPVLRQIAACFGLIDRTAVQVSPLFRSRFSSVRGLSATWRSLRFECYTKWPSGPISGIDCRGDSALPAHPLPLQSQYRRVAAFGHGNREPSRCQRRTVSATRWPVWLHDGEFTGAFWRLGCEPERRLWPASRRIRRPARRAFTIQPMRPYGARPSLTRPH